jgi:deazaflavin-dependent oxidoreductase (nitroreductase family)
MTQAGAVQERNAHVIAEFRANHGQVGGDFAGAPLLLHTVGARTGKPRVSPAMYLPDDGRYLIFATNGRADDHPAWYRNLTAHSGAQIEVGDRVISVHATELHGHERDDKYASRPGATPASPPTSRTPRVPSPSSHSPRPAETTRQAAHRRTPGDHQHPGPTARTGPPG